MTLDIDTLAILREALQRLDESFAELPAFEVTSDEDAVRTVLLEVAERLKDTLPFPHPMYAGQMLKPPHPVARLAYSLALWLNPNNHALDGGRASSQMEKEAVAGLAQMVGWSAHLGHLTGGGTMANLEALWVSGRLQPGKTIVASEQAHYTHQRISEVLQLPFDSIRCDTAGRMDVGALRQALEAGNVGTVVATLGTTGLGTVDPLDEIVRLRQRYDFRLHVDAAYGGYYRLVDNLDDDTRRAFNAISEADSIVIDPHKHGLQPYPCGCILFRDQSVGRLYKHDSPYTYFTSDALHLGEISLECSRPGAAAVALWATMRLLPLERGGRFAQDLAKSREAALEFFGRLENDSRYLTIARPELDVVVWAPRGQSADEISRRSHEIFTEAAARNLHLAKIGLPSDFLRTYWPDVAWDRENVTLLRSCLMKPEHRDWLDTIWNTLLEATAAIG